jgi:hypothetical protein
MNDIENTNKALKPMRRGFIKTSFLGGMAAIITPLSNLKLFANVETTNMGVSNTKTNNVETQNSETPKLVVSTTNINNSTKKINVKIHPSAIKRNKKG